MSESAFDSLVEAQGGSTPAAGPFWIVVNGATVAATNEELQAKVDAGYNGPVALQSDSVWKDTPSGLGFAKTVEATVSPEAPTPPAAPAAPTPPAAPGAAPAAPAPATEAAPAAPAATTAVTTEVAAEGDGEAFGRALPALIQDEASALAILGTLTNNEGKSLADIADTDHGGGGMAHSLPFAHIKGGNWDIHKSIETSPVGDYMPVGNRAYTAIYLAQRIGATSWMGKGSAGGGGNPPMYRYVVPSPKVHADGEYLANETMVAARGVQFCKGGEAVRTKFDVPNVGRISPEIQVLVWTPQVGFLILTCNNFSPTELSLAALKKVSTDLVAHPVVFTIKMEKQVNKAVQKQDPNADNATWDIHYLAGEFDPSQNKGVPMKAEFDALMKRAPIDVGNAVKNFLEGSDYAGLSPEEIKERLAGFKPLITK